MSILRITLCPDEASFLLREKPGIEDSLEHDLRNANRVRRRTTIVPACDVGLVVCAIFVLAVPAAEVHGQLAFSVYAVFLQLTSGS